MAARKWIRIGAALLSLVVAALAILLATPWPSQWMREEIVRRASLLGGEMTIDSLEVRLFPPRLVAEGIRYRRSAPGGEDVDFACRRADLSLPYQVYRGRLSRIDALHLSEPRVSWRRGERGRGVQLPAGGAGGEMAALSIGRVSVEKGSVRIQDVSADWEASIDEITLTGAGRGAERIEGSMEESHFTFRLGPRVVSGRISAGFHAEGKRVSISPFHLGAEAEGLRASGVVDLDLEGPTPRFHVSADTELRKLQAPRALLADLGGALHLDLHGESGAEGLHLTGAVTTPEVSYRGWTARQVSLLAAYRPEELKITKLSAGFVGGQVSGDVAFRWREGAGRDAQMEARISLSGGSTQEAMRLLGLADLPFTGRFDHTGEYQLRGFDLATLGARGEVTLSGELRDEAPEPFNGFGRFRIVGSRLVVDEASIRTPSTSARFQGEMLMAPGPPIQGTLQARTRDLRRVKPLLVKLPPRIRAPLSEILAGSVEADLEFEGRVKGGTAKGVVLEGTAIAHSLSLRGTRLGDLHADFGFSSSRLDLEAVSLSGGEVSLDLAGWCRPESSISPAEDSLALKGKVSGLELTWLRDWTGVMLPAEGKGDAVFDLSGRSDRLEGKVDWSLDRPRVGSVPLQTASGRLTLAPEGLVLEELRLTRGEGHLEASGSVGFCGAPVRVQVNGEGIELEWLHEAGLIPVDVRGRIQLQAQITGTLAEPAVELELMTPGASVKGNDVGALSARFKADRRGGDFEVSPDEKGIALTGRVGWGKDLPFEIGMELEEFEVAASSLGGDLLGADAGATLSGSLRAKGALRDVTRLEVSGSLSKVVLRLGQEHLVAQSVASFRWHSPRLEVTPFHLVGPGTDVTLSGHLVPEEGAYHLKAEGALALALLAPLRPGITAGGTGTFSLSLIGAGEGIRMEGWVSVLGGRLQGGDLPLPISFMEGRLVLDPPDGFHLEGVHLNAGGGKILLEGRGGLQGLRLAGLDVAVEGTDVQILYPEGFRGRYDLSLRLVRDPSGTRLGGRIDLIRGVYRKDFQIERNLLSLSRGESSELVAEEAAGEEGPLDSVALDLELKAERGLWIINDFATLEGRADFHIGGTVGGPQVTGRLSALEGGTIRFRQVRYRVEHGNIDLIEADRFNPYFDIAAETTVADYQVNLKLDGSLETFTYELTSIPPLSQPEILGLLVSGRSPDTFAETGRVAQDVAASYLTGGLAAGIGGRLQGATRLDQFSIDPVYLTSQGDPASRVTVGKQVSENLVAVYSTLLGSSSEEIYQLEYRISRDFKFTSTREADGAVGGDLRYLLRLRTGPGDPSAPQPKELKIQTVTVEGEPGMRRERLLRSFGAEGGDRLDRVRNAARVDKLLSRYRKRGFLQASVETREEPIEEKPDRVNLVLRVDSGPQVRIEIKGPRSARRHAGDLKDLWADSVFPEEAPEEARAGLEKILQGKGYYRAKVKVETPVDTPALRRVILWAEPGPRVRVEKIEIGGNQGVETSILESLLKTKPGRRSYLKPAQVSADAGRIRAHYFSLGYSEAKVAPPIIELSGDGGRATVRFQVVEGDPTKLAEIRIEGNRAISSEKLLEGFPIRASDPFTRAKARKGAEAIHQAYDRAGYPEARVTYELRAAPAPELVYQVEEGQRKVVGRIELEGNRLTRREVVERELTFKEGDPVSKAEVLKSQRALYRLGVFSSVDIQQVQGSDPEKPTVRIMVAESPNLTQSLGIGYASDEGIRGLYEITNANLLGRARTVALQLRGSDINRRAQVVLRDPYLFNRSLDSLVSGFWQRQEREGFTLEEVGTTLQVSRKLGQKNRTIYRYTLKEDQLSDVEITDPVLLQQEARTEPLRLSGLSGAYVHDSRDNFYNPRQGAFASFDLAAYGKALGSEAECVKFFAQGSLFRKVLEDSVWAQSIRLGLTDPFGTSEAVPISLRFFAGGDTTVRGFDRDELGPKDSITRKPTGGESLFIVNEEFRFPLWRSLRGAVFVDAGNVTSKVSEFDPLDLRTVLGAGLRWDTPIGPIRFEYGRKLDREEGESPGEFHISIGQAF